MDNDDDLALQTLLAAHAEVAPKLDEQVLRLCYMIQKRHQFSDDRSQSVAAMERLIDESVFNASTTK